MPADRITSQVGSSWDSALQLIKGQGGHGQCLSQTVLPDSKDPNIWQDLKIKVNNLTHSTQPLELLHIFRDPLTRQNLRGVAVERVLLNSNKIKEYNCDTVKVSKKLNSDPRVEIKYMSTGYDRCHKEKVLIIKDSETINLDLHTFKYRSQALGGFIDHTIRRMDVPSTAPAIFARNGLQRRATLAEQPVLVPQCPPAPEVKRGKTFYDEPKSSRSRADSLGTFPADAVENFEYLGENFYTDEQLVSMGILKVEDEPAAKNISYTNSRLLSDRAPVELPEKKSRILPAKAQEVLDRHRQFNLEQGLTFLESQLTAAISRKQSGSGTNIRILTNRLSEKNSLKAVAEHKINEAKAERRNARNTKAYDRASRKLSQAEKDLADYERQSTNLSSQLENLSSNDEIKTIQKDLEILKNVN